VEAIGLLAAPRSPDDPVGPDVVASGDCCSSIELLVSLGSAFIAMTVQGLGYYLLAFLVPVFVLIGLSVSQRRRDEAAKV
jgi:hypothetical protein